MIFRNYSEDSADESISSIKDLSSPKGEQDMDISDIEVVVALKWSEKSIMGLRQERNGGSDSQQI